jgi:hypothetical protein
MAALGSPRLQVLGQGGANGEDIEIGAVASQDSFTAHASSALSPWSSLSPINATQFNGGILQSPTQNPAWLSTAHGRAAPGKKSYLQHFQEFRNTRSVHSTPPTHPPSKKSHISVSKGLVQRFFVSLTAISAVMFVINILQIALMNHINHWSWIFVFPVTTFVLMLLMLLYWIHRNRRTLLRSWLDTNCEFSKLPTTFPRTTMSNLHNEISLTMRRKVPLQQRTDVGRAHSSCKNRYLLVYPPSDTLLRISIPQSCRRPSIPQQDLDDDRGYPVCASFTADRSHTAPLLWPPVRQYHKLYWTKY